MNTITFKLKPYEDEDGIDPLDIELHIDYGNEVNTTVNFEVQRNKAGVGQVKYSNGEYVFDTLNGNSGFGPGAGKFYIESSDARTNRGCTILLPLSYQATIEEMFQQYFQAHGIKVIPK